VALFLATIAIYVRIWPDAGPPGDRVSRAEFVEATVQVRSVVIIFSLVMGGIYFGNFNRQSPAPGGQW
jgi:hypothetical protein